MRTITLLLAVTLSGSVYSNTVKDLGKSLTPIGAESIGNGKDIPAWNGGIRKPPKNYRKNGPLVTPKAMIRDRPMYVVNPRNYLQHAHLLSAGHLHLFRTYPSYKLNIYESKRTAAFPKGIYKWTKYNAKKAKLEGTSTVTGAVVGFPFPLPRDRKSGDNAAAKIMFNHKLRHQGDTRLSPNDLVIASPSGLLQTTKTFERILYYYSSVKRGKKYSKSKAANQLLYRYKAKYTAPAKVAGQFEKRYEYIDSTKQENLAWIAKKGDTKATRTPTHGFDNPKDRTNGMQFDDQFDMFTGSLERYDWTLVGKREMLIPHNAYKGASLKLKYKDIMRPRHYNQDIARYEKHRVWVVKATLRKGKTHAFGKRVFYLQEDCWCIAMVDNYDKNGTLYRFQEAHLLNFYFGPTVRGSPELIYDFKTGNYIGVALGNESKAPRLNQKIKESEFVYRRVMTR